MLSRKGIILAGSSDIQPSPRGELKITDVNKRHLELGQPTAKYGTAWAALRDTPTQNSIKPDCQARHPLSASHQGSAKEMLSMVDKPMMQWLRDNSQLEL